MCGYDWWRRPCESTLSIRFAEAWPFTFKVAVIARELLSHASSGGSQPWAQGQDSPNCWHQIRPLLVKPVNPITNLLKSEIWIPKSEICDFRFQDFGFQDFRISDFAHIGVVKCTEDYHLSSNIVWYIRNEGNIAPDSVTRLKWTRWLCRGQSQLSNPVKKRLSPFSHHTMSGMLYVNMPVSFAITIGSIVIARYYS